MTFRKNITQAAFIEKANKMVKQIAIHAFAEDGICDALVNTYIKYASKNKKEIFFNLVAFRYPDLNEMDDFFITLKREERKKHLWLGDRICFDAFSFIASGSSELTSKMDYIIRNLQKHKINLYTKITLANSHAIALEQRAINDTFIYYIYDPNNNEEPKPLFSAKNIADEIFNVVKRIAFPYLYIHYLLDKNLILNFYVYPQDVKEEKDSTIEHLENLINIHILTNKENLFEDIKDLLERYKNKCAARGIVLSNIYFQLTKIQSEKNIDLREELTLLEKEINLHVLSVKLMPSKTKQCKRSTNPIF